MADWLIYWMNNSLRAAGRANGDGTRKTRTRDRPRAVPAPEANAELQANIDVCQLTWVSLFIGISLSAYTVLQAFVWRVQILVYWLTKFFFLSTEKKVNNTCKCKEQEWKVPSTAPGWCTWISLGLFKSHGTSIWAPRSFFLQHCISLWKRRRAYLLWTIGWLCSRQPEAETQVWPLFKTTVNCPC